MQAEPEPIRLFYPRLRDALDDAGVTAQKLAALLGVSTPTVYRWLASDYVPEARRSDVSNALDVEADILYVDEETDDTPPTRGVAWQRVSDGAIFKALSDGMPPPGYDLVFLD